MWLCYLLDLISKSALDGKEDSDLKIHLFKKEYESMKPLPVFVRQPYIHNRHN